jgi:hypothetical protein
MTPAQRVLYDAVIAWPGATQEQLCSCVPMSPLHVKDLLWALLDAGWLTRELVDVCWQYTAALPDVVQGDGVDIDAVHLQPRFAK